MLADCLLGKPTCATLQLMSTTSVMQWDLEMGQLVGLLGKDYGGRLDEAREYAKVPACAKPYDPKPTADVWMC